ncbi:MAG: hypothetical protein CVV44_02780 [Spirochaetae bacterium HGW-Spirochaetae-1]|jgi:hypothetical protein|nr:MAG: hypothetical protein CVV44_02780 [Spirochaetae bacterium HGW-Spirochaetae-1]
MADVKLNPVFTGFSKQIGDLVFVNLHGKTFVRKKAIPRQTNSEAQLLVRDCFKKTIEAWGRLNDDQKKAWEKEAHGKNMSGYNLFFRDNFRHLRAGETVKTLPVNTDGEQTW